MRSEKGLKTSTKLLNPAKIRPMLLVSLMILLGGASSCTQSIKWDPNFYKASSVKESIKDRNQIEVKCSEPRFDEFACLHKDKIKELAEILSKARLPKDDKRQLLKVLNDTLRFMK